MSTDSLEKQYNALIAKSCDNNNRISIINDNIQNINDEIESMKEEMKKVCNTDIVIEKHYVDMYKTEIESNTKLYNELQKKNKALKKRVKVLESRTHNKLNYLITKLTTFYIETRPKQIKNIHKALQLSEDAERKSMGLQIKLKEEKAKQQILQAKVSKSDAVLNKLNEQLFDVSAILSEASQSSKNVRNKQKELMQLKSKKLKLERRYNQLKLEYDQL
jgi:hypothetical protein